MGLFHQRVMCFVQNATGSTKKGIYCENCQVN